MLDKLMLSSLQNRLIVLLAATATLAVGVVVTLDMPIDVFPDLTAPTVSIMTEAHGMAPEEVHRVFDTTLAMAPWNDSLRARIYAQYSYIASTRHDPRERARLQRKAASLYP